MSKKLLSEMVDQWGMPASIQESVSGLFHLSPNKFTQFKQSPARGNLGVDLGFHFGTQDQALKRVDQLFHAGRTKAGSTVYLYEVQLDVSNPIHIEENRTGGNTIGDLVRAIFQKAEAEGISGITDEMLDGFYEDRVMIGDDNLIDISEYPPGEQLKIFKRFLDEIGHDSISYENAFEGPGVSYIVFDPAQIKIVGVEELSVGEPIQ